MPLKKIAIINGPNMNLLGFREAAHYGVETLSSIEERLCKKYQKIELIFYQSNSESEIVEFIHSYGRDIEGVILNPAALTIQGYSILEAMKAFKIPFLEVHLSNIYGREKWHGESIFSSDAIGTITGLKGYVYELGLKAIMWYLNTKEEVI